MNVTYEESSTSIEDNWSFGHGGGCVVCLACVMKLQPMRDTVSLSSAFGSYVVGAGAAPALSRVLAPKADRGL